MCLKQVAKRTTLDEGVGWKAYIFLDDGGVRKAYSTTRNHEPMLDCWLLNQEPDAKCTCRIRKLSTFEAMRERYTELSNAAKGWKLTDGLFVHKDGTSFWCGTCNKNVQKDHERHSSDTYEHGFHIWKDRQHAFDDLDAYAKSGSWFIEAQKHGECDVRPVQVFWRGYIAEDATQIVSRQLYVPFATESPADSARIYDTKKGAFVDA